MTGGRAADRAAVGGSRRGVRQLLQLLHEGFGKLQARAIRLSVDISDMTL